VHTTGFLALLAVTVLGGAWLLSAYLHRVYDGRRTWLTPVLGPVERLVYRVLGIEPERDMTTLQYTRAVLMFSAAGFLVLYLWQRLQASLPLNPLSLEGVRPDIAMNTAISFVTNTNWQSYVPERTMSYLTQAAGLAVQNFVSAATGMAVAVALIRGFTRSEQRGIGNFWADLVRGTLYVLVPIALVIGVVLVARGTVMTFDGPAHVKTLEGVTQTITRGPAASQVAIKQLGTNGGGFFNANSAHPYEAGTPFADFLHVWALLLIPFAFPFLYGRMLGRPREGVAIVAAMLILLGAGMAVSLVAETRTTPALTAAGLVHAPNMEGKEQRNTVQMASIFSIATTATSTGAVNASHDSLTALAGGTAMTMILLGEVAPGGVGTGLYGILMFAVITVFIGGLMVGRTPEFLGKTIGAREVKLALIGTLVMPLGFLAWVGVSSVLHAGTIASLNAGPHGFSEILYAFASAWNNNGSAMPGITANTPYYDSMTGAAMLFGRFAVIVPALALAGALARQRTRPIGIGTMPTASPIFVGLLVGVILLVGALSFFPALALGPVAEALTGRLF
jgi:potassium-transporting ATPase potassium-binding subunit